jgi:esterase/lipase superfamily enzyme
MFCRSNRSILLAAKPSIIVGIFLFSLSAATGCATSKPQPTQVLLMPAPDVYEDGRIDPFIDNDPISRGVQPGILYATDRRPAGPEDKSYRYFTNERGHALHLGLAEVRFGHDESITWEEARRISLLKNRTTDYPLEVSGIEPFGVLEETIRPFDDNFMPDPAPGRRFAEEIDKRLAISDRKDVYIYVHGYKVHFESPVLVASEFWHFLGYNGAFIAYSWPTKASMWSYLADLDKALNSARYLRTLILYIARHTDVEHIHVIGYSMGTRLVARMLADLGMYGYLMAEDAVHDAVKLGHVILTGADVDRSILGGYLIDGALRVPQALTIYQSSADKALGVSRRVFGRERAGQVFETDTLGPRARDYFLNNDHLFVVDVTNAEGSTLGKGHGYFRGSPWVSSDILITLMYDLAPTSRGLVQDQDSAVWRFPDDYMIRLREALARKNPALTDERPEAEQSP